MRGGILVFVTNWDGCWGGSWSMGCVFERLGDEVGVDYQPDLNWNLKEN